MVQRLVYGLPGPDLPGRDVESDHGNAYGQAIGEEARYRNKAVLLGPGVNIYRLPLNGRNFEYMGEDPSSLRKWSFPTSTAYNGTA